jgi:hypothetical protein
MGNEELKNLNNKIYRGLEISFHRLVNKLSAQDGELVVSQNGKVVRIKARTLQKQ